MAKGNKKQNVSFAVAAVLLAAVVVGSIVMFAISSVIHDKATADFTKSLYPVKYEYYVEKYAEEFDVDTCLVYGVIRTESGFNPDAVSPAGAIGLMQLMPDTFTWLQNYRTGFEPEELLDSSELYKPSVNIEYGTYLLRYLLERYDGDESLAIIAYNAGYGNVDKWLADGTIPKSGVTSDNVPFSETANYLDRVTESMNRYHDLYYPDYNYVYIPPKTAPESEPESVPESEPTESYAEGAYEEQGDQGDYGENYADDYNDGYNDGYNDDYGYGEGYDDYYYEDNNVW